MAQKPYPEFGEPDRGKSESKQRDTGHPYVATSIFAIGYLAAWAGFSLVAVTLQWGFQRTGILSPMLVATNAIFGGFLLLAACIPW